MPGLRGTARQVEQLRLAIVPEDQRTGTFPKRRRDPNQLAKSRFLSAAMGVDGGDVTATATTPPAPAIASSRPRRRFPPYSILRTRRLQRALLCRTLN